MKTEREIKVLVFETKTGDEEFFDQWMVVSPSLHGVLACIMCAASARCHDHMIGEHLEAHYRAAVDAGDRFEAERLQKRMRTSRAFSREAVAVYAQTHPDDIDELTTASRWRVATFPKGMLAVAEAADMNALLLLAPHVDALADTRLARLTMDPATAGILKDALRTARLPVKEAEPVKVTAEDLVAATLDKIEAEVEAPKAEEKAAPAVKIVGSKKTKNKAKK